MPRNEPDLPELTVTHINFIRVMINALVMTTCDDLVGWANALASPRFTNDVKARLPTRLGGALKNAWAKLVPGLTRDRPRIAFVEAASQAILPTLRVPVFSCY